MVIIITLIEVGDKQCDISVSSISESLYSLSEIMNH